MAASSILLIDDDAQVLNVISEMLRIEGHRVTVAENGSRAQAHLDSGGFDLVITDLLMPEREGLETIMDIRRRDARTPILAISGGGRVGPGDYLETARYLGANATLAKPFGRQELLVTVSDLLTTH
ncbi:MAG: response regulator [Pseudomonadales bacterium]